MKSLTQADIDLIYESIKGALVEIEQLEDISQGVEDDLKLSLEILKEHNDQETYQET